MKTVFSGVQPSGEMTLGNYLGAFRHFKGYQDTSDRSLFSVVDLHAITVPQDPSELRERIYHVASVFLAAGVDPAESILFAQSDVSAHAELAWVLNTIASMGELGRMTQFKEKGGGRDSVSVGLFDYPVLMAADVLLYDTTHVPVGDDQKQHLELARDLAQRFNSRFGETFTLPQPMIAEQGARIMSLQDPQKKMSKSDDNEGAYILLTDTNEAIQGKVKRAVTDSGSEIASRADKPAMTNLLTIFSLTSGRAVSDLEREYAGSGYAEFKADLAEAVVAFLSPIREQVLDYSHEELDRILQEGAGRARELAGPKLKEVKEKLGLWR